MSLNNDLWNFVDNEPWLDNGPVLLINRRKRRTRKKGKPTMARRPRGLKRSPARRRRVSRRPRLNVPRRRRRRTQTHMRRRRSVSAYARNPRRRVRRYRRNSPIIAGLDLKQLLVGGASVIVAPMIERQLLPLVPTSLSGTTTGRWAVKLGAALATWYVAKMALGRRSSDVVAIALGSSIVADAVQEFAPGVTTLAGVGAYTRGGLRAYPRSNRLGLVTPGQSAARAIGPGRGLLPFNASMQAHDIFQPPF